MTDDRGNPLTQMSAEEERDELAVLLEEALAREGVAEQRTAEFAAFVRWVHRWNSSQRPIREYSKPVIARCEEILRGEEWRMTDDRGLELTHILVDYARQVGAGSSFSGRVAAMTLAREQILELFKSEAAEVVSGVYPQTKTQ